MKNIMIVDDDPAIQDALRLVFSPERYTVNSQTDGNTIVDRTCSIPDIFLLDKQLSGVDGLDLCRMLKEREETKNVPVIVMSASPHVGPYALAAGADAVLEKPFSLKVLRELIVQHIGKDDDQQLSVGR